MNNYNRTISMAWQANTDAQPCTSQAAVVNYVVKYVGKAEKKTESFKQVAVQAMNKINSNRAITTFVAKFMNRLIAERDWSAQEVHHLLLGLPLHNSTRIVQNVDCRHPDEHWQADLMTTNLQGL
jgi:ATP-dependent DNA helicase PIF1